MDTENKIILNEIEKLHDRLDEVYHDLEAKIKLCADGLKILLMNKNNEGK